MELLIVVSVLAILASVALPRYANAIRRAQEGGLKGNLGALRSALSLYYGDNQGIFPACAVGANSTVFNTELAPKYIGSVPTVKSGLHPPVNTVYCDYSMVPGLIHDGQGWYYDGAAPADSYNGGVWVACDHTDTSGGFWTSY